MQAGGAEAVEFDDLDAVAVGVGDFVGGVGAQVTAMIVGVFSNAIGYGIDQHVMRKMAMRRFAVMLALLPVTALAMGFIALDQRPSPFNSPE
jgi:threonine/homoserine efflux transporter RhtA